MNNLEIEQAIYELVEIKKRVEDLLNNMCKQYTGRVAGTGCDPIRPDDN